MSAKMRGRLTSQQGQITVKYLISLPASNSGDPDKLSSVLNTSFPAFHLNLYIESRGQLTASGLEILV